MGHGPDSLEVLIQRSRYTEPLPLPLSVAAPAGLPALVWWMAQTWLRNGALDWPSWDYFFADLNGRRVSCLWEGSPSAQPLAWGRGCGARVENSGDAEDFRDFHDGFLRRRGAVWRSAVRPLAD